MAVPRLPWWKIRRELHRVSLQARGLFDRVADPLAQARLDAIARAGLPMRPGAIPLTGRVAICLLYQPKGLSRSTLRQLAWLEASGYAPLVVSNAPLSPLDRMLLDATSWQTLERPNFGHDFGGYRDALWALARMGVSPKSLLVMNDSTWMPMLPDSDILRRLEDHPADIAGTILRRRGQERFLESHLYRIRGAVLGHPSFVDFWTALRLTSNKYYVIRRGERGFSRQMQAAGLTVGAIYSSEDLPDLLAREQDAVLRRTLQYGAYIDGHLRRQRDRLLTSWDPDWRDHVLAHVRQTLEKRQAYSSFPYAMVRLCGYPLLKRSADLVSAQWRAAHLDAVRSGDLPEPAPEILAELEEAVSRARRGRGWETAGSRDGGREW